MQNIDLFDMITDMLSNIGQSSTRTCPKNRQDCEHPKNAQFDIYAITSNFFTKFQ